MPTSAASAAEELAARALAVPSRTVPVLRALRAEYSHRWRGKPADFILEVAGRTALDGLSSLRSRI